MQIEYKESDFICNENDNSSYYNLHKAMKTENANVYIGFCGNNLLAHQLFDTTFPVLEETALWAAPKLKQGQDWKFITQFFTLSNWILSFAVLMITALAFRYFASKAGESDRKYRTLSQCLLFIYSCFFNMGNNILPKDAKLRIICLSLGPFALNISAYLQGKLFGALTHPVYMERSETNFEELQKSFPLVIQEYMLTVLLNSRNKISMNYIKSNRISTEYDLQDMVRYQNLATVITEQILQNHPRFTAYIQTHEIARYQIVMYVMKHDCFYSIINESIKKLVEHGFTRKIAFEIKHHHMLHCLKYRSCWDGHTKVFSLTSIDLRGAFFMLNCGFAIGVLIFLIEVSYYYFNCNQRAKQQRCCKIV